MGEISILPLLGGGASGRFINPRWGNRPIPPAHDPARASEFRAYLNARVGKRVFCEFTSDGGSGTIIGIVESVGEATVAIQNEKIDRSRLIALGTLLRVEERDPHASPRPRTR